MADSSADPIGQVRLDELRRNLGALTAEFGKSATELTQVATRSETAVTELETATRKAIAATEQKAAAGGAVTEPGVLRESATISETLAAAQEKASQAAAQRLALEEREAVLLERSVVSANALRTAQGAQSAAQSQSILARRELGVARRGTPADELAATETRDAAAAELQARRREVGQLEKVVGATTDELSAVFGQLEAARAAEAASRQEVIGIEERNAVSRQLTALLEARKAQLEAGGIGGGGGGPILPPAPPGGSGGPRYGGQQPPAYGIQAAAVAARQANIVESPVTIKLSSIPDEQAAAAAKKLSDQQAHNIDIGQRYTAVQGQIAGATEYQARILSNASQAYSRHGALQTEWLAAFGKGQVTLKDFTSQMTVTIGKFAGWSAAAAAVYGVLGAVTELGKGAIEGLSGVGNLQRTIQGLDTQRAGQEINQLSQATNVDLKVASDAVFQFSRTFHNLDDATYVAGLALRAFKLDGVSVSDQVKAATAINQQFGVSAQNLGPIYGLLAQGQREFNARVNEMIPALLGSASQIATATSGGVGSLTDYVKLLQLALRTTQLTGAQLATAFRRSPGFIARPSSQAALTALGFDPKEALTNYTGFLQEALKRSQTFTGEQRRQLQSALFATTFGPRLAGLFRSSPEIQQQILGQDVTSQKPLIEEFSRLLNTPKEQIAQLGNGLQRLGSNLGQSGLLSSLGLVVRSLNEALKFANGVLGAFSAMPGPLKTIVGLVAAARIGGVVAGRFPTAPGPGIGGGLGQIREGFNPGSLAQRELGKAIEEETGYYRDLQEGAAKTSLRLGQQVAGQQAYVRYLELENADEDRIVAEKQRTLALVEQQQRSIFQESEARAAVARADETLAAVMAASAAEAEAVAASLGVRFRTASGLARPGGGGQPVPLGVVAPGGAPAAAASAAQAATNEAGVLEQQAAAQAGVVAATTRASLAARAAQVATGAGTAAIGAGSAALRGLGSIFTPFNAALFGLPLLIGSIAQGQDAIKQSGQNVSDALAKVLQSGSIGDLQSLAQKLQQQAAAEHKQASGGNLPLIGGLVQSINEALPAAVTNAFGAYDHANRTGAAAAGVGDIAASAQAYVNDIQKDIRNFGTTQKGRQLVYDAMRVYTEQIKAVIAAEPGLNADQRAVALNAALTAFQNQYNRFQSSLPIRSAAGPTAFAQFKGVPLADQVKNLQALADHIKVYGAQGDDLKKLALAEENISFAFRGNKDDASLQQIAQAQTLYVDALHKNVEDLKGAADAITVPSAKVAGEAVHASTLKRKAAALNAVSAALKAEEALLPGAYDDLAAATKAAVDAYNASVANLQKVQDTMLLTAGLAALGTSGTPLLSGLANLSASKQAVAEAKHQIQVAKNNQKTAAHANQQAAIDQKAFENQIAQQLNAANNAAGSGAAAVDPFQLARLRREIAKASFAGDPVAQARVSISEAQDEIRVAKNEQQKLQGQLDLVNAQNELTQALRDVTAARFKYLESLTTDPIKIDQIGYQAAQALVKTTKPGTAARYDALASRNAALEKLRDDRVAAREDDIQFALSMHDITDQQAIAEIQGLLRVKNLSYSTRKRLRRELEQLQKGTSDTSLELDLNNIRLPSTYELRRGLAQAQGGIAITNQNSITINAPDVRAASAVGVVMDRYVGSTGKSVARAQGIRGG